MTHSIQKTLLIFICCKKNDLFNSKEVVNFHFPVKKKYRSFMFYMVSFHEILKSISCKSTFFFLSNRNITSFLNQVSVAVGKNMTHSIQKTFVNFHLLQNKYDSFNELWHIWLGGGKGYFRHSSKLFYIQGIAVGQPPISYHFWVCWWT